MITAIIGRNNFWEGSYCFQHMQPPITNHYSTHFSYTYSYSLMAIDSEQELQKLTFSDKTLNHVILSKIYITESCGSIDI